MQTPKQSARKSKKIRTNKPYQYLYSLALRINPSKWKLFAKKVEKDTKIGNIDVNDSPTKVVDKTLHTINAKRLSRKRPYLASGSRKQQGTKGTSSKLMQILIFALISYGIYQQAVLPSLSDPSVINKHNEWTRRKARSRGPIARIPSTYNIIQIDIKLDETLQGDCSKARLKLQNENLNTYTPDPIHLTLYTLKMLAIPFDRKTVVTDLKSRCNDFLSKIKLGINGRGQQMGPFWAQAYTYNGCDISSLRNDIFDILIQSFNNYNPRLSLDNNSRQDRKTNTYKLKKNKWTSTLHHIISYNDTNSNSIVKVFDVDTFNYDKNNWIPHISLAKIITKSDTLPDVSDMPAKIDPKKCEISIKPYRYKLY